MQTVDIQTIPTTQTLARSDLPGVLQERKGANFVTFMARVKVRLNKTGTVACSTCSGTGNRPNVAKIASCTDCVEGSVKIRHTWGNVSKISIVNGQINWKYEGAVRKRQEKYDVTPADFESAGRAWGKRVAGTPFIGHKGKQYLEVRVLSSKDARYFAENGMEIPYEDMVPFFPKRTEAKRQVDAGVPVEDVVICRDYGLDNLPDGWGIQKISINGEVFEVE